MSDNVIDSFTGPYRFLSNFSPHAVVLHGYVWPTAEHAYQVAKTDDQTLRDAIREAPAPALAKRLGRRIVTNHRWTRDRYAAMAEVLDAKFTGAFSVPSLLPRLRATGDAVLIEGNVWHDQTWGDCRCGRPACAAPGLNALGRMLMELRDGVR